MVHFRGEGYCHYDISMEIGIWMEFYFLINLHSSFNQL